MHRVLHISRYCDQDCCILVHSWLKVLAVNLSWPFGWLWLYAGLIGSVNPRWLKADLVAYANPSSFWWYWLTHLVPDQGLLNGCACVFLSKMWYLGLVRRFLVWKTDLKVSLIKVSDVLSTLYLMFIIHISLCIFLITIWLTNKLLFIFWEEYPVTCLWYWLVCD